MLHTEQEINTYLYTIYPINIANCNATAIKNTAVETQDGGGGHRPPPPP